jgi:hypothetical protein
MDIVAEEWRSVEGYEGLYEVSNHGRIRSLSRMVSCGHAMRQHRGKLLSPRVGTKGYLQVMLCRDGVCRECSVHVLAAKVFLTPDATRTQVNHKNGRKDDNQIDNLEWMTNRENKIHGIALRKCAC